MNWVGGARNRVKLRDELTKQKEYFEKKRYENKVRRLERPAGSSPKKRKQPLSTDLLSLQAANYSAKKFSRNDSSSPISRGKVIRVDLNQSRSSLSSFHRLDDIELPMSPGAPSKLLLQEATTSMKQEQSSSTNTEEGHMTSLLNASKNFIEKKDPYSDLFGRKTIDEPPTVLQQQQQHPHKVFQGPGFRSSLMQPGMIPEKFQDQNKHRGLRQQVENEQPLKQHQHDNLVFHEKAKDQNVHHENSGHQLENNKHAISKPEVIPNYKSYLRSSGPQQQQQQLKQPQQQQQHLRKYTLPSAITSSSQHDIHPAKPITSPNFHSNPRYHHQSDHRMPTNQQPPISTARKCSKLESNATPYQNNLWTPDHMSNIGRHSFEDRASENLFFQFHPTATSTVKRPPLSCPDDEEIEIIECINYSPVSYKSDISIACSTQTTVNSHEEEEEEELLVPQTNASTPTTCVSSPWETDSISSLDNFSSSDNYATSERDNQTRRTTATWSSAAEDDQAPHLSDSSLTTFRQFHRKKLRRRSIELFEPPLLQHASSQRHVPQTHVIRPPTGNLQCIKGVDLCSHEAPDFVSSKEIPQQSSTQRNVPRTPVLMTSIGSLQRSEGVDLCSHEGPDFVPSKMILQHSSQQQHVPRTPVLRTPIGILQRSEGVDLCTRDGPDFVPSKEILQHSSQQQHVPRTLVLRTPISILQSNEGVDLHCKEALDFISPVECTDIATSKNDQDSRTGGRRADNAPDQKLTDDTENDILPDDTKQEILTNEAKNSNVADDTETQHRESNILADNADKSSSADDRGNNILADDTGIRKRAENNRESKILADDINKRSSADHRDNIVVANDKGIRYRADDAANQILRGKTEDTVNHTTVPYSSGGTQEKDDNVIGRKNGTIHEIESNTCTQDSNLASVTVKTQNDFDNDATVATRPCATYERLSQDNDDIVVSSYSDRSLGTTEIAVALDNDGITAPKMQAPDIIAANWKAFIGGGSSQDANNLEMSADSIESSQMSYDETTEHMHQVTNQVLLEVMALDQKINKSFCHGDEVKQSEVSSDGPWQLHDRHQLYQLETFSQINHSRKKDFQNTQGIQQNSNTMHCKPDKQKETASDINDDSNDRSANQQSKRQKSDTIRGEKQGRPPASFGKVILLQGTAEQYQQIGERKPFPDGTKSSPMLEGSIMMRRHKHNADDMTSENSDKHVKPPMQPKNVGNFSLDVLESKQSKCKNSSIDFLQYTNSTPGQSPAEFNHHCSNSGCRDQEIQCQLLMGTSENNEQSRNDSLDDINHGNTCRRSMQNACVQTSLEGPQPATVVNAGVQTMMSKDRICSPEGHRMQRSKVTDCGVQCDMCLVAVRNNKIDKINQLSMANSGGRMNTREHQAYGPSNDYDKCCVS